MDAKDVIQQRLDPGSPLPVPRVLPVVRKGMVLIHMRSTTGSWETPSGVKFTAKSPYQVVIEHEANVLLNNINRFELADPNRVKEFFGV